MTYAYLPFNVIEWRKGRWGYASKVSRAPWTNLLTSVKKDPVMVFYGNAQVLFVSWFSWVVRLVPWLLEKFLLHLSWRDLQCYLQYLQNHHVTECSSNLLASEFWRSSCPWQQGQTLSRYQTIQSCCRWCYSLHVGNAYELCDEYLCVSREAARSSSG